MNVETGYTEIIFGISLLLTFAIAVIGRRISQSKQEDDLAGRELNRWLVGLREVVPKIRTGC